MGFELEIGIGPLLLVSCFVIMALVIWRNK